MIVLGFEDSYKGSESQLQKAVARYLNHLNYHWNHIANERQTTPRRGRELKDQGVKAGMPDVMIYEPYMDELNGLLFGVAIELKVGRNKLTKDQKMMMNRFEDRGYMTILCYSFDALVDWIRLRHTPNILKKSFFTQTYNGFNL